jgi:hypothetical protein
MDAKDSMERLNLQSEIVALAIIGVAVLLILYLNRRRLQLRWREWRLQRCLGRIGCEQIRGLVCADGLDGFYSIDRLALVGDAILLISYKPHVGNIYCAEKISEWTQVIGRKSFKFDNPLFELENQLIALKTIVGNAPLRGYLFFGHGATFPKGHPDSVLQPDTIPANFLRGQIDAVAPDARAAWGLLQAQQANPAATGELGVKT